MACVSTHSYTQHKYEKGEILVTLKDDLFHFTSNLFGVYVSFNDKLKIIKVDSAVYLKYKDGSRQINLMDTISYYENQEKCQGPELNQNLPKILIHELNDIEAYYIGRVIKTFFPEDTTFHAITSRTGTKWVRSHNYNKYLIIKYKSKIDPIKLVQRLENLDFVEHATVNEILSEF
jgi:hypothetical protein